LSTPRIKGTSLTRDESSRPHLLMINSASTSTRKPQMDVVSSNFAKHGIEVNNTYGYKDINDYYKEISSSKFILCPSGVGWDSYRIWEALSLGTIPVIERHKYRYELVKYPKGSHKKNKILRSLEKGDDGYAALLQPSEGKGEGKNELSEDDKGFLKHLTEYNATVEIIEYYDGWRKNLDDLPVVWIDGEFGDQPPSGKSNPKENENDQRNYLTPEFLDREYDRLAARTYEYNYEKLTSLYWVRFLESFLLLSHPEAIEKDGTATKFASLEEQKEWYRALETMSSTLNNQKFLKELKGSGWKTRVQRYVSPDNHDDEKEKDNGKKNEEKNEKSEEDNNSSGSPYLFGDLQPKVLSWVLLLEAKVLGIVLMVVGIRLWNLDTKGHHDNGD